MFVKKGDTVVVISGKDKGKSGVILESFPKTNKIVVDGINISKRHIAPRTRTSKGQIVEKNMPIDASNVRLSDTPKKAARVAAPKKETKAKAAPKAPKK
jgi:large subunit ribosomal protein L24